MDNSTKDVVDEFLIDDVLGQPSNILENMCWLYDNHFMRNMNGTFERSLSYGSDKSRRFSVMVDVNVLNGECTAYINNPASEVYFLTGITYKDAMKVVYSHGECRIKAGRAEDAVRALVLRMIHILDEADRMASD